MTNDTTTLNGSLMELGELMTTNLITIGVTASASDGLTTLVNKVLRVNGDNTYVVSTLAELDNALSSVTNGQIIYIKNGEYVLTKRYDIPTCTIIGESKTDTIIKSYAFGFTSGTSTAEVCNLKFDGNGVDRGDAGMISLASQVNVNIHDCHFTNMSGQWNCHGVRIATTSSDKTIEIHHNLFDGNNTTTGYGHTKSSIAGYHLSTIYNLQIHHNTFNHPSGGSNTVFGGKAIALFNNNSAPTLVNCSAYNNSYLGAGDSNNNITETTLPESTDYNIMNELHDLGGRLALILNKKNITANANDGLTTLTGKILSLDTALHGKIAIVQYIQNGIPVYGYVFKDIPIGSTVYTSNDGINWGAYQSPTAQIYSDTASKFGVSQDYGSFFSYPRLTPKYVKIGNFVSNEITSYPTGAVFADIKDF